jgi:hypothetical protein
MIGRACGTANLLDLALVLDRSERLDDPGRRRELETARAERLDLREGQCVGLEREAALEPRGEVVQERALAELGLDPGDGLGVLDVAEVGEEPCPPAGRHEQGRVGAVEARQVEDVGEVRDQQRPLETRAERVEARGHASTPAR